MDIRKIIREFINDAGQQALDKERPVAGSTSRSPELEKTVADFNNNVNRDLILNPSFDPASFNRRPSSNTGVIGEDGHIPNLETIEGEATPQQPKKAVLPNVENYDQVMLQKKQVNELRVITRAVLLETVAGAIMDEHLKNKRIKKLMQRFDRGAPFYSFGATKRMMQKYVNKKEKELKHKLDDILTNAKITHIGDEIVTQSKDEKQIFTIKLEKDRLKSSYIRLDFTKPKQKIKIRINISPEEINDLILGYKNKIEEAGFHIFK